MFTNKRYITCGVAHEIPDEIQTEIWIMIEKIRRSGKLKLNYLQVFQLFNQGGKQKIIHSQEQPEYHNQILIIVPCKPVKNKKIFVIDDGDHSTMLLAEEY